MNEYFFLIFLVAITIRSHASHMCFKSNQGWNMISILAPLTIFRGLLVAKRQTREIDRMVEQGQL